MLTTSKGLTLAIKKLSQPSGFDYPMPVARLLLDVQTFKIFLKLWLSARRRLAGVKAV